MELTPREKDKLLIFTAALLAERRKAKGLKLNYPEAVALISAALMEGAREGRSVQELMSFGTTLLSAILHAQVERLTLLGMEALFGDGDFVAAGSQRWRGVEPRIIRLESSERIRFDLHDLYLHARHDSAAAITHHTRNGAGVDLSETRQGAEKELDPSVHPYTPSSDLYSEFRDFHFCSRVAVTLS